MISKLIAKIIGTGDDDFAILGRSAKSLVVRVIGAFVAMLFSVFVARSLGVSGTGIFYLAFALITVGSMVSRFGMDTAVIKIVGRDFEDGDSHSIHGLFLGSTAAALGIGCTIGFAIWWFAPDIARIIFDRPELSTPLKYLAPAIPLIALLNVQAAFFLGVHKTGTAISLQYTLTPALAIALTLIVVNPVSPESISRIYSLSALLACGFGVCYWYVSTRTYNVRPGFSHLVELFSIAPAMLLSKFMNRIIMRWLAVILLGYWASSAEVGQFAVAARLTLVVSFALVVSNAVVAPRFAKQFADNNLAGMARAGSVAARTALLLSGPIFVVFVAFPDWVMSLFGSEFRSAGSVLVILAIGELVNVITGPVGYLLQMSRLEKEYRNCTILGGLTQLILCVILIPRYGAIGAATATALALALSNLSAAAYAWHRLRIIPVPVYSSRINKNVATGSESVD